MANKAAVDPIAAAMAEMGLAKEAAKELTNGAIRCSVPSCGGIVKKDFVIPAATPVGLCPQREVHDALKAQVDATGQPTATAIAAKAAVQNLVRMYQLLRARKA